MERIRELLRRTGWTGSTAILVGVVVVFLVLFLFVPLASMFRLSLFDRQGFTLDYLRNALASSAVRDSLIHAALLAVVTTATSTLLALPLAYVNVRSEFLGKRWISPLLLVPMILPPFVGAIGMKQLLGPYGVLNAVLVHLHLVSPDAHIDWFVQYPLAGIVLLQTLHLYPIIYLNVVASLANVDPSLEDAARNAGASPWTLFRKVTLPLAADPQFFRLFANEAMPCELTVTTQPGDAIGGVGTTVTWQVEAIGTPAPSSFQWQRLDENGLFEDIPGATAPLLTWTALPADRSAQFRCKIANGCSAVTSLPGKFTLALE